MVVALAVVGEGEMERAVDVEFHLGGRPFTGVDMPFGGCA